MDVSVQPNWDILKKKLPPDTDYKLISADQDEIHFRVNVRTPEAAQVWVNQCLSSDDIQWRRSGSTPPTKFTVLSTFYRCNFNTRYTPSTETKKAYKRRNTNCGATFHITLPSKAKLIDATVDKPDVASFPLRVIYRGQHNHPISGPEVLTKKDVSDSTKEALIQIFRENDGIGPGAAREKYREALEQEAVHVEEYESRIGDRSIYPNYHYVQKLYNKLQKEWYGICQAVSSVEIAADVSKRLGSRKDLKVRASAVGEDFVVSFMTPLMERAHNLREAGELVFLDSSEGMDRLDARLFFLVTHSSAGGIPLGGFITNCEKTSVMATGLQLLQDISGTIGFFGRGSDGPLLFVTGGHAAESAALQQVYPKARQLLCTAHLLNSVHLWLRMSENRVKASDRGELNAFFRDIVYEKDEQAFCEQLARGHPLLNKYPAFKDYMDSFLPRKDTWAHCFRNDIPVRGKHTVDYVESKFSILKTDALQKRRAVNPIHLLVVIATSYEKSECQKLLEVAHGREPLSESWIEIDTVRTLESSAAVKVSGSSKYTVQNSQGDRWYSVDLEVGCCTCPDGVGYTNCKHQQLLSNTGCMVEGAYRSTALHQRRQAFRLATGTEAEPGFLEDLRGDQSNECTNLDGSWTEFLDTYDVHENGDDSECFGEGSAETFTDTEEYKRHRERMHKWLEELMRKTKGDSQLRKAQQRMLTNFPSATNAQLCNWFKMTNVLARGGKRRRTQSSCDP